ncbi:MAG: patatin-like phospholipase family protein [Acidimicrobiales bacterium]
MTTIGLVLGAGGVVGQAYHAGVLAALHERTGWDPRSADIIVGSSAGSITGSLLRLGMSPADLAAMSLGSALSLEGETLVRRVLPDSKNLPRLEIGSWFRLWRLPTPALLARVASRPWSIRPEVVAMTMLPAGTIDLSDRAAPLHEMIGDHWPDGLWICAVRRSDGVRVVFGRDGSPPAPLASSVLASCAIPAYFAPVTLNGVEYFDGGVHSPTNADVLRSRPLDTVVVISPMSTSTVPHGRPDALLRWTAHRRLEREIRKLEASGSRVVRVEPVASEIASMGLRPMEEARTVRVVEAAYQQTLRRIADGRFTVLPDTGVPLPL